MGVISLSYVLLRFSRDKTSADIIHDFCHSVKGYCEKNLRIFVYCY
jgi:hypothetical protein